MFVGYFTKMESSLLTKHILLGWVIYGVGIYIFLFFYSRIEFKPATKIASVGTSGNLEILSNRRFTKLYLTLLGFILLPSILGVAIIRHINNKPMRMIDYQVDSNAWQKTSKQISNEWKPNYPDGDTLATATYSGKNSIIYMYISHYIYHRDDIEPINMDNTPYNPDKWVVQRHEILTVSRDDGKKNNIRLDRLISKSNQHMDVLSFYIVNGKIAATLVQAKLATLFGMLQLKYDIKVVCLAYQDDTELDKGDKTLIQFYKALQMHSSH